jgi:hypothetical protein
MPLPQQAHCRLAYPAVFAAAVLAAAATAQSTQSLTAGFPTPSPAAFYTMSIGPTVADGMSQHFATVQVPQFDPLLGQLASVALQFRLTCDPVCNASFAAPGSGSTLLAVVQVDAYLTIPTGPTLLATVSRQAQQHVPGNAVARTLPLGSGGTTSPSGAPTMLSAFVGTGTTACNLQLDYAQAVTLGAQTVLRDWLVDTNAIVTVTYGYAPFAPASKSRFGAACAGSGGQLPRIDSPLPHLGSPGFALALDQALPNSIAVAFYGPTAIALLPGGCMLFVDPQALVVLPWTATDATGHASAPIPLPADPALAGAQGACQFAVLDPLGGYQNMLAFSDALVLLVGP